MLSANPAGRAKLVRLFQAFWPGRPSATLRFWGEGYGADAPMGVQVPFSAPCVWVAVAAGHSTHEARSDRDQTGRAPRPGAWRRRRRPAARAHFYSARKRRQLIRSYRHGGEQGPGRVGAAHRRSHGPMSSCGNDGSTGCGPRSRPTRSRTSIDCPTTGVICAVPRSSPRSGPTGRSASLGSRSAPIRPCAPTTAPPRRV